MKKIAFYLPQFHSIPENDNWWGKGFTEWTNVKKSQPQFKGHLQPEIPLDDNYYCLLDSKTQEKQSELALKYGIDCFCYYHYWFEGKLLLEKPAENMLKNPNIKIQFCMCWANESWARTWDGLEKDILIKQNYNEDEEAWKKHFEYLLDFFKDDRYLKDNGNPILVIYKPHMIKNCTEMIAYWKKLAKQSGFTDLIVAYQHPSAFDDKTVDDVFDFGIEFEPLYTTYCEKKETNTIINKIIYSLKHPKWLIRKLKIKFFRYPNIHCYDDVWNSIISRYPRNKKIAPGAFPAWDNTPRKADKADVYFGATPEKFKKYFDLRMEVAEERYGIKYMFINAWNEWAEGAHLEPDKKNGYGYLEAVKKD